MYHSKYSILAIALMINMISIMSHCYTLSQNVATTGSNIDLPIIAKVIILNGAIRCSIPQGRPSKSPPLVANVDTKVLCGDENPDDDYRIAVAQTLFDPSLGLDFVFDILGAAGADPTVLGLCRLVLTYPDGSCVADLAPVSSLLGNLSPTYHVPVYEAKNFHDYNN